MAHFELSTEINAPPQAVWDFISDLRRVPEWVTATDEMLYVSEGEVGVGTVYRERGGVGPFKSVSEWRITEFDPPHRQVHVGDLGVMKMAFALELEPTGRGTLMRQTGDFRMMPFFRPLGLLLEALFVRRQMESGGRSTLANAKRILEAEQS